MHGTSDPGILGVRFHARYAKEHPKAARIDRSGHAGRLRDRAKRFFREERRTGIFVGSVDALAGTVEADQLHRAIGEGG